MNEFLWGGAVSIFKYFEIFNYIRYFDIDCTIVVSSDNATDAKKASTDELEKVENVFNTYDYFFHHNIKFPKIIVGSKAAYGQLKLNEDLLKWKEWTYQNFWKDLNYLSLFLY